MKKVTLLIAICLSTMNVGLAQNAIEMFMQPTHVVARRINAAGEITKTLEADFTYNEDGKLKKFLFPDYSMTANCTYEGDYLKNQYIYHNSSHPMFSELYNYTYEEGRLKHTEHLWGQMNANEFWNYEYDDFGRMKLKEYKQSNYSIDTLEDYHMHYHYEYEDNDRTVIENYWTSWENEGLKLRKKTSRLYDEDYKLQTVLIENYNLDGEITSSETQTYSYTPTGKDYEQITLTLTDGNWVNTSIQRFIYDEYDRIVEQQNGSWSAENGDWDITKRMSFVYEPSESNITCTVSFYKKSGEEWVWDTFNNQTVLFGPQLKSQQKLLVYFVYEDLIGYGNINQFEFTFTNTPSPVYMGMEDKENLAFTIHPNPTSGQVIITGKELKSARVINTLGQCVATVKGEGEQITVDISDLPAGVYFVNVTDSEGRKCVRKVVKE